MITIYFAAYNEEVRLQFMLDHYKSKFPNCNFVMNNNASTDNTVEIAKQNNCEIIQYDTGGEHNDDLLLKLKNNCWKGAKTDWVLVCDPDELLDINENSLKLEESLGTTIVKSTAYQMIDISDDFFIKKEFDISKLTYGARSLAHDKSLLFNKKQIVDINYNHGCHVASPTGNIKYNTNIYNMYHYHFINMSFIRDRYKMTNIRFSDINRRNGWGFHVALAEDDLIKKINNLRNNSVKII